MWVGGPDLMSPAAPLPQLAWTALSLGVCFSEAVNQRLLFGF